MSLYLRLIFWSEDINCWRIAGLLTDYPGDATGRGKWLSQVPGISYLYIREEEMINTISKKYPQRQEETHENIVSQKPEKCVFKERMGKRKRERE